MQLPADYHMHTPLCRHAAGEPVDYARRAVELGLTEIGFSDHSPMARDDFDDWRMLDRQLDEYVAKVRLAQRNLSATHHPPRAGSGFSARPRGLDSLSSPRGIRGIISSAACIMFPIRGTLTIPPSCPNGKSATRSRSGSIYFERLTLAAESKLFDIIGHADLPKKFGIRPAQDCTPLYEKFLAAAAKASCAIELNTAGLRKDCREIYPSRELLRARLCQTCADHLRLGRARAGEVGMNFAEAVALARSVGYTETVRFHQRQRESSGFEP